MKLKGSIIYAFVQELRALFNDGSVTILVKTDFKKSDMPTYKMPMIEIDMRPGDDSGQFLGGLTMEDYHCTLSVYNFQQAVPEDPTSYSATRVDIADTVRQQFSTFSVFLSAEMTAAFNMFGMKLTYAGSSEAVPLDSADGLKQGTAIRFNVVAFDNGTTGSQFITQFGTLEDGPPDVSIEGIEQWGVIEW